MRRRGPPGWGQSSEPVADWDILGQAEADCEFAYRLPRRPLASPPGL